MTKQDTSMGGKRGAFPETVWSQIVSCRDPASPERRARLNQLLSMYWRPVYTYVRASKGKSVEDAKDLTQEFFATILESDLIARYEPQRGRFRHFLKAALKNFMAKEHRDMNRQKRGGGVAPVSLDVAELETDEFLAERSQATPDEIFDRQWARDVILESLDRLRGILREEGKEIYFRAYERYVLPRAGGDAATYDSVARDIGISAGDVRNYLHHVRERLQGMMQEIVSDYVTSNEELMQELRELFSS